jgi:hypothetical protein
MFVRVKVSENVVKGNVVTFNSEISKFDLASSMAKPLGVVIEEPFVSSEGYLVAAVGFAGEGFAIASRDIPEEGGELNVESGMVYVDNTANGEGIILPLPYDQTQKVAGDMVMVYIR